MGIPHLTTYLRPYAESQSLAGKHIIVDGPGLCYHIHHKCLSGREAGNALEASPSYGELRQAVLEWVDGLRDAGAVVQKIYFDGFLPPAKLKTRLERLRKQTKQLNDYHATHAIPCRTIPKSCKTSSLFENRSTRRALATLPPPPFLVPAALETFKTSKLYKDLTEVVPGEADLYCARYANIHGGVVLTGDSDLLVHDLGSDGAVSFFADIQIVDEKPRCLRTLIYQSAAIAKRLGLPKSHGLCSLAFEMFMDNHGTFSKLVSQAASLKAIRASGIIYEDFCKEYKSSIAGSEGIVLAQRTFQDLDPRISELVLQFPQLAKLGGQNVAARSAKQDTPHMFLPFLLDCPERTSAWEISTPVRQLAYGMLNLVVPKDQQRFAVVEHRRQQKIAGGREWQLPSLAEIPLACMTVVNRLKQLENRHVFAPDIWVAATICQDLEWSSSLDKTPLSQIAAAQLFDLQTHGQKCTWDTIHFLAQTQGSYYSFRILKQIIRVVTAQKEAYLLPESVWQLNYRLESMSGFCEVSTLSHVTSMYQRINKGRLLEIARELTGTEEPAITLSDAAPFQPATKGRKSNSLPENDEPSAKDKTGSMARNPFELLAEE